MQRTFRFALVALFALIAAHASAFSGTILRLGTDHASDYVTTVSLREFAQLVEKETNGGIKIDIYDGGQLGQEKACLEQVTFGALEMAKISMSPLSEFVPKLTLLNLPYLFRNIEHMWASLDGEVGDNLKASAEEAQIVILAWVDGGSRSFYSEAPIYSLADIKGRKIRVPESRMMMAMMDALGGHATPMPASEIYSALQTGICEAAENNIPYYSKMSHFEVAPYLLLDRHNIIPETLLIGKSVMDGLSPSDQAALRKCAAEFQKIQIANWTRTEEEVMAKFPSLGVTVTQATPALIAEFRQACQSVYDDYAKENSGNDNISVVDAIAAVK